MRTGNRDRQPWGPEERLRIALVPGGDRFEDFYNKIGVSLEDFRLRYRGGWLFNFVEGLRQQGVGTVLVFASTHVGHPTRFTHEPTGAHVCVLPAPKIHVKARNVMHRRAARSPMWTSIGSYISVPVPALARELRRYGCCALLCQEYESPRFDVCVLVGRLLRQPVFATYQGANAHGSAVEAPTRRLAVHACSGLVIGASSEISRVRSRYRIGDHKIAHIPNSVDVRVWQPRNRDSARSEMGLAQDASVVAWHGRVQIERKGLDVLLDAWRMLRAGRVGYDDRLLLIGSGRDRDALRSMLAAPPLRDEVIWIDRFLHEPQLVARHLAAADVYCLPSRGEGFAVAVLEAMACGLPVVAADVAGITDVFAVGESSGGVVVPPCAPGELARALGALLDDPGRRRKLGEAARRRVEDEYTIEAVGGRLWNFMRSRGVRDPRPP